MPWSNGPKVHEEDLVLLRVMKIGKHKMMNGFRIMPVVWNSSYGCLESTVWIKNQENGSLLLSKYEGLPSGIGTEDGQSLSSAATSTKSSKQGNLIFAVTCFKRQSGWNS